MNYYRKHYELFTVTTIYCNIKRINMEVIAFCHQKQMQEHNLAKQEESVKKQEAMRRGNYRSTSDAMTLAVKLYCSEETT